MESSVHSTLGSILRSRSTAESIGLGLEEPSACSLGCLGSGQAFKNRGLLVYQYSIPLLTILNTDAHRFNEGPKGKSCL